MALVKICGTTSVQDALLAQSGGAHYVGLVIDHPPSPRNVSQETARTIVEALQRPAVAVTVNLSLDALLEMEARVHPGVMQLHGDESPDLVFGLVARGITVWKAVNGEATKVERRAREFRAAGAQAILLDAREQVHGEVVYGGTGKTTDWGLARHLVEQGYRIVLAGGLTPENVPRAITAVQPWMVDAVSGVEEAKGVKSGTKIYSFVQHALEAA